MNKPSILKYYLFVALSGVLSGVIVFGGKVFSDLGLSLFQISFLVTFIGIIPVFLFLIFKKQLILRRDMIGIFLLYGFLTAMTVIGQFSSVILGLPVAIGVLLLYTQPLWTVIYAAIFFKKKITVLEIICSALVLLGVLFLVNPWGSHITSWPGFIAGLLGGIGLSGWILTGSAASKKGNHPTNTFVFGNITVMIFLLIFFPIARLVTSDPALVHFGLGFPPYLWIYLILFSLLTSMVNHISYFYGVKVVPAVDAGIIMLLEPVVGTVLAALFLAQKISLSLFIGGALILISNYLIIRRGASDEQVAA
jgi:drug/metabolite transporter (DMT)-like permease